MMGHTFDVYHAIQSKGVEFLRGIYSNSGLSIIPKPQPSPVEALRAFARGHGLTPDEAGRLLASSEPHRIFATQQERDEHGVKVLSQAIKELIKREISSEKKSPFA